jgi:hypothetical protein
MLDEHDGDCWSMGCQVWNTLEYRDKLLIERGYDEVAEGFTYAWKRLRRLKIEGN